MRPVAAEQAVSFNAFWLPHHVPFSRSALQLQKGVEAMSGGSDLAGGYDVMSAAKVSTTPSAIPILTLHPVM